MVTGETQTGFKYSYNEKITRSLPFLDALIQSEKPGYDGLVGYHDLMDMLLGKKKAALYKHLEKLDPDGIATIDAARAELVDMINGTGTEGKN